ncbi:MAG: UvrD/REP helicase [Candidatus Wolfebacteria bacterium GW2011_GWA1_47_6]|nr:MAG: UvrD/REP helicase [Candidatus Wolfebacteria bacterium GW2011_GWA1_47_6]
MGKLILGLTLFLLSPLSGASAAESVCLWSGEKINSPSVVKIKLCSLSQISPQLVAQAKADKTFTKLIPTEKNTIRFALMSYVRVSPEKFLALLNDHATIRRLIENIKELIEFASGFEKMEDFLERISLLESTDTVKKKDLKKVQDSVVNLMTIHMAKGLEFDAVFVIGVNDGLLPHQMSYHNENEIEEERRLMYVAMTRARKELYLTFYHLPSRFLSEIPSGLMEFEGGRGFDDEERYIDMD